MTSSAPDQPRAYLLPQSVVPRGLAYVIDTVVVASLMAVLMAAGVLQDSGLKSLDPDAIREMLRSNAGLSVYLILFAYFFVCEGVWGRTVGKRALGLRVVRLVDGKPCGWSRSLVRNLIRPFDLLFIGLPGAIVVVMTPARQRLGDLLGGTLVVRRMNVPAAMAAVVPGLLRTCSGCGRLAPAAGACPGCAAPPPPPSAAPGAGPFGAAVVQPLAGMMAVGEAAAALRAAAQETLAAESAYGAASAAESARLGRAAVPAAAEAVPQPAADEVSPVEVAGDPSARVEEPPRGEAVPESVLDGGSLKEPAPDTFVHTDDAPDLSDDYVASWRGLMSAVATLRGRRADLEAALATARISIDQVTAADSVLSRLLDEVDPYLDSGDDEAVLAAFMARASSGGGDAGAGTPS